MRTNTLILVLICFGAVSLSQAQEEAQDAAEAQVALARLDFYQLGMKAYEDNDYITALKYLFAYRVQHEAELQKNPDSLLKLNEAINYCEQQLRRPHFRLEEIHASTGDERIDAFVTRMQLIQKMLELQQAEIQEMAVGELGEPGGGS